jgi:hypothetical protein
MQLTQTLLGYLNRVFNKDPAQVLAMQFTHQYPMTWQVQDGVLTTSVQNGLVSGNLTIDLTQYTFAQLVNYIAAQPGYITPYLAPSMANVSAAALLDASGSVTPSEPPQPMYAYTSVLWAYLECSAAELELAAAQIQNLPLEMSTTTADTIWLDTLGSYYKVPRNPGEEDSAYGPRIIASVLRPMSNNVAIEMAISTFTGQDTTVTDVVIPGVAGASYNSVYEHNGAIEYNAVYSPAYGLFDVEYGYDLLNGQDPTSFAQTISALINTLRAAGTHLRSLTLTGSNLSDALTPPTDSFGTIHVSAPFTDTLTAPTDSTSIIQANIAPFADTLTAPTDTNSADVELDVYQYTYSGGRSYNGVVAHEGGIFVLTPAPSIDWDLRGPSLDPSLTFTRASIGTYFNSQGVLQTAAANTPRFDWNPATGRPRGLLVEESRTNSLLYSQGFDNAAWSKSSSLSITTGAITAPDGSNTGFKLCDTDSGPTSVGHSMSQPVTSANAQSTYTLSVYAQAADRPYLVLRALSVSTTGNYFAGMFHLDTGACSASNVGTATGATASMQPVGNGWYRCSITGIADPAGTGGIDPTIFSPANSSASSIYVGTPGQGIYVWAAQLEAGAFATSLIPTTTAAVKRAQDVLTSTSFPWFNANAGTFAIEAAAMSTLAGGSSLVSFDDGANNGMMLYKPTAYASIAAYFGQGAVSVPGSISSGTPFRAAFAYSGIGLAVTPSGSPSIYRSDWQGNQLLYPTARTNISPAANNSAYGSHTLTATTGQAGPDGSTNAVLLTDSTTSAWQGIQHGSMTIVGATQYCYSAFVKPGTLRYVALYFDNGAGDGFSATFDLQAVAVTATNKNGTATNTASGIQSVGNGWYRIYITAALAASDTSGRCSFLTFNAANSGWFSAYAGNGSTVTVFGFQLEPGSTPTSYIPTTSASATAAADYSINATGLVTLAAAPVSGATMTWSGTGTDNLSGETLTASGQFIGTGNGSNAAFQLAVPSSLNAAACAGNAATSLGAVATGITPSNFSLGSARSDGFAFSGWLRRFTYANYTLNPTPLSQYTILSTVS